MSKISKAKLKAKIHSGFGTLASQLVDGGFTLTSRVARNKMHFRLAAQANNIRPKARGLFKRASDSDLHEYSVVLPVAQRSVSSLNKAIVKAMVTNG